MGFANKYFAYLCLWIAIDTIQIGRKNFASLDYEVWNEI